MQKTCELCEEKEKISSILFDCHCHIFDIPGYELKKGFYYAVCGYSKETSEKALEYCEPNIVKSIGIAPQNVIKEGEEKVLGDIKFLEENAMLANAIGETGLDYKWGETEKQKESMEKLFIEQIRIARKFSKPLIIHSRRAESRVLDILEEHECREVLLHSFSGNAKEIMRACALDFHFTISPKAGEDTLKKIPIERAMLESDCPFIGKTPEDIRISAQRYAKYQGMDFEKVLRKTCENGMEFFKL